MPRSYRMYCSVYGCLNSSLTKPEITFFRLPSQSERLSEWLRLMCRDDLVNKSNITGYRICEEHFNVKDILPTINRKVLKKNAYPLLNMPDLQSFQIKEGPQREEKQTQTDNTVIENHAQITNSPSCSTSQNIKLEKVDEVNVQNDLPILNLADLQTSDQKGPQKDQQTQTENTVKNSFAQTKKCHSCDMKRKLQNELSVCRKKIKILETDKKTPTAEKNAFHKLCDKFLTNELALLVKAQTNLKIHGQGNRYNTDYIIFCLSLYFMSPQAYRFLQNALCLPCTSTLYKYYFPITTEINERAMSILKMKLEHMTEVEKNCSVMIYTMNLKANLFYNVKEDKITGFHEVDGWQTLEAAKKVLVIMVRGIFVNWKQPVAYALLSQWNYEIINEWVDKVLGKLLEIGLNIRTFVSDQGPVLWNAAKKRNVCIEKPYFFVNDRKIYYIFDAPNLIKNVRDSFMQYDFHFGNSIAKYEHIVQFYNHDVKKSFRLARKITTSHIKPTNFEKKNLCYAIQLFSKSVATGISTYVDDSDLDDSARGTAKLIIMMNDLFDILNSSNIRHNYEYKRAYAGFESQNKFFRDILNFFRELKLINPKNGRNCTSTVRFIEGFQITITSLSLLFDDLRLEGYTFLFTRRLNQEVMEKLFGQIRTRKSLIMNPTCKQFVSTFKKVYFSNIIKPLQGRNFARDLGKLLVQTTNEKPETVGETSILRNILSNAQNEKFDINTQITPSDYNKLDVPEKKTLFYICSYILKRCSEKHNNCLVLKTYIKPNQGRHSFRTESRYSKYRDYTKDNLQSFLIVPTDDFVEYVEEMDKIFRASFKRKHVNSKVCASIYEEIKEIPFSPPCACFPKKFLVMLFIRTRIFYTVKFNNKSLYRSRAGAGPKCFSVDNL